MRRGILILTILILTIVSLFVARTVVSNKLSTSGVEFGKTQEEIGKYKTENLILSEKVYNLSSLGYIASAAAMLGFSESKSSFAVTAAVPLAIAQ